MESNSNILCSLKKFFVGSKQMVNFGEVLGKKIGYQEWTSLHLMAIFKCLREQGATGCLQKEPFYGNLPGDSSKNCNYINQRRLFHLITLSTQEFSRVD